MLTIPLASFYLGLHILHKEEMESAFWFLAFTCAGLLLESIFFLSW